MWQIQLSAKTGRVHRAADYLSSCSRRRERNSDQNEPTNPAPFRSVCHHEGLSAPGVEVFRRQDARPATSEAAADAMELRVRA